MSVTFDPKEFIRDVLKACKLGNMPPEMKERLEDAIFLRLSNRLINTITSEMTPKDVEKFDELIQAPQDNDPFDALMRVANGMPGMDKKLEKAIVDLYEELTYDAERIDDAMKLRKAMDQMNEADSASVISGHTFTVKYS